MSETSPPLFFRHMLLLQVLQLWLGRSGRSAQPSSSELNRVVSKVWVGNLRIHQKSAARGEMTHTCRRKVFFCEIAVISVVENSQSFYFGVMQKTHKSTILSQHKRAAEKTNGDKVKVLGLN